MPTVQISPVDLAPEFRSRDEAEGLIRRTIARAAVFAPCILDSNFGHADAAAGVLVDVIERRLQQTAGVSKTRTVDEASSTTDTKGQPHATFWPSEIAELQALCRVSATEETAAAGLPRGSFPPAPCHF